MRPDSNNSKIFFLSETMFVKGNSSNGHFKEAIFLS